MTLEWRRAWIMTLCAAAIMMVTTGVRFTSGLFLSPLNSSTGLGVVAISFAMAIAQVVWGAAQPISGALADRFGPAKVVAAGGVLLAIGLALTTVSRSALSLTFAFGVVCALGCGGGSFSTLMAVVSQRVPAKRRALASGVVNAGASSGQLFLAPAVQWGIGAQGWVSAMLALAALALVTLPLALPLRRAGEAQAQAPKAVQSREPGNSMWREVGRALRNRDYLLVSAAFGMCGFHLAFLITHVPGEVELYGFSATVSANMIAIIGLFNIVGSLAAGALSARFRMKNVLAAMYVSRAFVVLAYLAAPKTASVLYVTAAALGVTWLATVPPTVGLIGAHLGTRHIGSLFGITLFAHQVGGYFGAWLGGLALAHFGNYQWMWIFDAALALLAAGLSFLVRDASAETGTPASPPRGALSGSPQSANP